MKYLILICLFIGCIFAVYQNLTGFVLSFVISLVLIFRYISYDK